MMKIQLVGFTPAADAALSTALKQAGMRTQSRPLDPPLHQNFRDELAAAWSARPANLVIAALPLPLAGDFVTALRTTAAVPIITIVNAADETAQLALYRRGANLVVVPPYSPAILVAQAQNLAQCGQSIPLHQLPPLTVGAVTIDPLLCHVSVCGQPNVQLSQREFQLFYLLFGRAEKTVANATIIEALWGYTGHSDLQALRTIVHRVRAKLGDHGSEEGCIQTVTGIGYRFVASSVTDPGGANYLSEMLSTTTRL